MKGWLLVLIAIGVFIYFLYPEEVKKQIDEFKKVLNIEKDEESDLVKETVYKSDDRMYYDWATQFISHEKTVPPEDMIIGL